MTLPEKARALMDTLRPDLRADLERDHTEWLGPEVRSILTEWAQRVQEAESVPWRASALEYRRERDEARREAEKYRNLASNGFTAADLPWERPDGSDAPGADFAASLRRKVAPDPTDEAVAQELATVLFARNDSPALKVLLARHLVYIVHAAEQKAKEAQ